MTTIRQKKAIRKFIDHATPDDRLRHSKGMGELDEYQSRKELSVDAVWLGMKIFAVIVAVFILWRLLKS